MDEEEKKQVELVKENCIFCKMAKGEIDSYKVYEDEKCMCVLDINPVSDGHLLIVPKEHYMIMPVVPDELLSHLGTISKKYSEILKEKLDCEDVEIFLANGPAAGQQSNHFLIQLIPKYNEENIKINLDKIDNFDTIKDIYEKIVVTMKK